MFFLALLVACVGVVTAFAFVCLALYDGWLYVFSPAIAALVTSVTVLVVTALIVGMFVLMGRGRRDTSDAYSAGRTIGSLFAKRFRSYAEENPHASLLMSLLAGFAAGTGD